MKFTKLLFLALFLSVFTERLFCMIQSQARQDVLQELQDRPQQVEPGIIYATYKHPQVDDWRVWVRIRNKPANTRIPFELRQGNVIVDRYEVRTDAYGNADAMRRVYARVLKSNEPLVLVRGKGARIGQRS